MHDQELRDRFAEWARPLQGAVPPSVSVIRARARRRTARYAAASAAMLTVVGVIAGLVVSGTPGGTAAPPPSSPRRAGQAAAGRFPPGRPYLMTLSGTGQVAVTNEATGARTGTLRAPGSGYGFGYVAAAPDDREFILAAQDRSLRATRFYVLRLGATGRPGPLRLVPGATGVTGELLGLAVNASGAEFAVATIGPGGVPPGRVWIFGLSPAAAPRSWSSASGAPMQLSFARSGQLGFGWQSTGPAGQDGLRILTPGTGSPGITGSLLGASRLAVRSEAAATGLLTPDGATVVTLGDAAGKVTLEKFSAASGRLRESVPLTSESARNSRRFCGVLWSDATGHAVLAQCGAAQRWVTGAQVTRVRLRTAIDGSEGGYGDTFAW